jgi:hypothetical protein
MPISVPCLISYQTRYAFICLLQCELSWTQILMASCHRFGIALSRTTTRQR